DIEVSKRIMEEEDKLDKQMYRNLVKEKRKAKKLKLKAQKAQSTGAAGLSIDNSDNDMTDYYIDALPDPDALYQKEDGESNENNVHSDDPQSDSDFEVDDISLPQAKESKVNPRAAKRKQSLATMSDSSEED